MMDNWRTVYFSDTTAQATLGPDKSFTVPTDREWLIESLLVKLITSGTAGTRQLQLTVDRGQTGADTEPYIDVRAGVTQIASLTNTYCFAPELLRLTALGDSDWLTTPIPEVILPAGWVVRVFDNSAGADSADVMEVKGLVKVRAAKSST